MKHRMKQRPFLESAVRWVLAVLIAIPLAAALSLILLLLWLET